MAQQKTGTRPEIGSEHTATIGSPIFERFRYTSLRGAFPTEGMAKSFITGTISIQAGEALYPTDSKAKLKACSERGPCALDDDGDGRFDRIALNDGVRAFKLAGPVAYEVRDIVLPDPQGNFKQTVSYLGMQVDTLRLSYREFMNDLARPAFTEELTIPISKTFPQSLAFKDVRMTVLGIDSAGLRYRIEP